MKKPKPPDPFKVFYNARCFHIAASFLDERPNKNLVVFPVIVCEAFGLELHLKCLQIIRHRWDKVKKSHNVREMFELLSKSDQRRIKKHLRAILLVHEHYDVPSDKAGLFKIDSILDRASTMFINARYWHELPIPTDAKGAHRTPGLVP